MVKLVDMSEEEIVSLAIKNRNKIGVRSGRAEIVGIAGKGENGRLYVNALCDCGVDFITQSTQITSGRCNSCGCLIREANSKRKFIDLTGQIINDLYIESYAGKNTHGQSIWNVVCYCGNRFQTTTSCLTTGHTKSCGCRVAQSLSNRRSQNLIGRRYGRFVVYKRVGKKNGSILWECHCDCGNVCFHTTKDLNSGKVLSCGCLRSDINRELHLLDLSGRRYGYLDVIRSIGITNNRQVWECRCRCGNLCYVNSTDLTSGHVISCGCIRSVGENRIEIFLKNHGIQYEKEKLFIGCNDVGPLRFDFWISSHGLCVEYDGIQHYQQNEWFKEDIANVKRRDAIKTKYCEENDIILLRIPYWEKDNIESILKDWLFLNDEEEANSSDVGLSA